MSRRRRHAQWPSGPGHWAGKAAKKATVRFHRALSRRSCLNLRRSATDETT